MVPTLISILSKSSIVILPIDCTPEVIYDHFDLDRVQEDLHHLLDLIYALGFMLGEFKAIDAGNI